MSQAPRKGTANSTPELPRAWRLFLVVENMKVVAYRGGEEGNGVPMEDLADHLTAQGLELAEVGELLVYLEDLPENCELRIKLDMACGGTVVARRISGSPALLCLVVRPKGLEGTDSEVRAAWSWGLGEARNRGLLPWSLAGSGAPNALVVDRNPEIVAFGRSLLRKLGCRAAGAGSGGEALALANGRDFDLVLIDSEIRGVGAETLASLLQQRSESRWGKRLLSATMLRQEGEPSAAEGERIYVAKPLELGELKVLVDEARSRRRTQRGRNEPPLELPVLDMEPWFHDKTLLGRLARTLVAQGRELSAKIEELGSFALDADLLADVRSLMNGCEIVLARRLGEACRRVLDEADELDGRLELPSVDSLLAEIDRFRVYTSRRGLLPEED